MILCSNYKGHDYMVLLYFRFRNWNTRLTLSPNGHQPSNGTTLMSPNYAAFKK